MTHADLVAFSAKLCAAHARAAEALIVQFQAFPAWARDDVLLSEDLFPRVVASLEIRDSAAASVCQAWRRTWVATADDRRELLKVSLMTPEFSRALLQPFAVFPTADF